MKRKGLSPGAPSAAEAEMFSALVSEMDLATLRRLNELLLSLQLLEACGDTEGVARLLEAAAETLSSNPDLPIAV